MELGSNLVKRERNKEWNLLDTYFPPISVNINRKCVELFYVQPAPAVFRMESVAPETGMKLFEMIVILSSLKVNYCGGG